MAEIIEFTGNTLLDIECRKVVESLIDIEFESILVIGFKEDRELFVASHTSDIGALLLMMEYAKDFLLHDADTV